MLSIKCCLDFQTFCSRGRANELHDYLVTWTSAGIDQDTVTPIGQTATATMSIAPETTHIFLRLRVTEQYRISFPSASTRASSVFTRFSQSAAKKHVGRAKRD